MKRFDPKQPGDISTLGFNLSLPPGASISSATFTVETIVGTDPAAAILVGLPTISGSVVTQRASGGVAGCQYLITISATLADGSKISEHGVLLVDDVAQRSSLFSRPAALATLNYGAMGLSARSIGKISSIPDDIIWGKILAAEAEAARYLKVPLEPTEIFPGAPTPAELASIAGRPYKVEPGYDMPPDFFSGNNWGLISLREVPVIDVHSVVFQYPSQPSSVFTVPPEWLKIDSKYGHIRMFPSAQIVSAPLSMMMLQAIGAGYNVPHMVKVRYTAGIDASSGSYADIQDLVLRMAVLRMLHDSMPPQSGSISADGLSRSLSYDMDKMQATVNSMLAHLREQLIGPVWSVL